MFFLQPIWAQSIVGPQQGSPGQPLIFRLMNGATQLQVDRWVQVLNPDRYAGNDYVTSFTLQLQASPDGALTAIAPAPGRYKIAAFRGAERWSTYVLVRPLTVVPEIRGAEFIVSTLPVDKTRASNLFALAMKAGLNWAYLIEVGGLDFDASSLSVQVPCTFCTQTVPLDDYGWLIDEAHRQGLKVAVSGDIWAHSSENITTKTSFFVQHTQNGSYGDLPPFLVAFPSRIPAAMRSYSQFMVQMAQVAEAHNAEALVVGNESNLDGQPGSGLWSQKDQWNQLFSQLRLAFKGRVWMGMAFGGCTPPVDLDIWRQGDGINAPSASGLFGSAPACTPFPPPSIANLTAEQMASNMQNGLTSFTPLQLKAVTRLPLIWRELVSIPVDGINFLGGRAFGKIDQGPRDNQEMIDYFEAQMRTVGQHADAFLPFAVDLSNFNGASSQDVFKQPSLMNAIANWWGGDIAYFEPCLSVGQPVALFHDDFEPSACPVEQQDALTPYVGWEVIQDPDAPENHVLRGSEQVFLPQVPSIGGASWTDYTVKLRIRLAGGPTNPSGQINVRNGANGSKYLVGVGFNQVALIKINTQGTNPTLGSYAVAGGTQLDQWYQLQISAIGPTITVMLNGAQVIQVTDQNEPLLNGGVTLYAGSGLGAATVDFDDIEIDAAGRMLPAINDGGVVSAANYAPQPSAVAGSIAAVFGDNLSSGLVQADTAALPTWLGLNGVSLLFNSTVPAPIFFVAPQQINIQIPWELSGQTQASLTVTANGVSSSGQTVQLARFAPAIFSMNQQGTGQGAILIANTDTIAAPAGSIPGRNARPAKSSEYISIYCTGLGEVTNRPVSGAATPNSPLSTTLTKAEVTIGGIPAKVSFSGLAPGYVGLYQINAQLPVNVPPSDAAKVTISIGAASSNTVTMAVQ